MTFLFFLLAFIRLEAHSLEEGLKSIQAQGVQTHTLIIKFKDESSRSEERLHRDLPVFYDLRPLFKRGRQVYVAERNEMERKLRQQLPHLEKYSVATFRRTLTVEEAMETLSEVYQQSSVEFAYFEPITENAVWEEPKTLASPGEAVPNYESRQNYLEAAPQGVGAREMWKRSGGNGAGVKVIDIENGWNNSHQDFKTPFFTLAGSNDVNHGTAVWGEVAAKRDEVGTTGIAYGVDFGNLRFSSADSYDQAASKLSAGDIIIIEQHQYGPDGNFTAMEYWRANFDAFKMISAKGILILEAAGNGYSNLDSSVYQGAFDLKVRDSGAILVGAAGSPGSSHLEKLGFSNYGSRVDAFGYGNNVTTTGYGNLYNGSFNTHYTATFSGTSSATPIVAGAVACLQGVAKNYLIVLTPAEIREALRKTGTPQKGDTSRRIGNLPDLKQLFDYFWNS